MSHIKICCSPGNPATEYAAEYLESAGLTVTHSADADTTHLLLPVPTRCFDELPEGLVIIGGNLHCLPGYDTIDLLKDPEYLAQNAAITARCAIKLIGRELKALPVLILGWGRIGKCLGKFLSETGADVTIAARKAEDLAMIRALGYHASAIRDLGSDLTSYKAILNTVPSMILPETNTGDDCTVLELASRPGMAGSNIMDARGLPGRYAPEESGRLIAETVIRLITNKEGY